MTAVLHVNEHAAIAIHVHVPRIGPWFADCDLADEAAGLTGDATITIDAATLTGTIEGPRNGVFGLQRRCRVIGGKAGWHALLAAKSYHNDAGVKGALVAQDAASECGESLPDAAPLGRLGVDYLRPSGVASRVLEDACRGTPWWVDYDGVTRLGDRAAPAPTGDDYTVITHNPRHGELELAVDDVTRVGVGSVLTAHLDSPLTVTSLEIAATAESLRIHAWCGNGERSSLVDSLRGIVERITDGPLYGVFRYRVINMNGDRVDLQRCGSRKDLPNTVATSMWPGVSGAHAQLARGCEVLVSFIDGDRAQPAITGFVGRGGPGDVPERLELGGKDGADAARKGDTVTGMLPPALVTGTVVVGGVPSPFTGAVLWSPPQFIGTISDGSSKVGVKT